MLRVGLTGGLGSGKSTAGRLFAAHGAYVMQADEIAREMMQPGQAVYAAIVAHFGARVVKAGGELNRSALAQIAFSDGRVDELNAIVHPAVIARQEGLSEEIFARDSDAVVIVESALIFETRYGAASPGGAQPDGDWKRRFDRVILVTAPEDVKVARFVARVSAAGSFSEEEKGELGAEARRRLAQQISDEQKSALCDYILTTGGPPTELEWQVDQLWPILKALAFSDDRTSSRGPSLTERGRTGRP
jgi:dephospho-CoA kinase